MVIIFLTILMKLAIISIILFQLFMLIMIKAFHNIKFTVAIFIPLRRVTEHSIMSKFTTDSNWPIFLLFFYQIFQINTRSLIHWTIFSKIKLIHLFKNWWYISYIHWIIERYEFSIWNKTVMNWRGLPSLWILWFQLWW